MKLIRIDIRGACGALWTRSRAFSTPLALLAALALAGACGGDEDGGGDPDAAVDPGADAGIEPTPDAGATGEVIEAPTEVWTWVPFDDAVCADGSPTGLGINLSDASTNALIFLQGGGACWDNLTCYVLGTATNLDGYGEAEFANDANGLLLTSLFDRTNPANPFRDWSFVFIPYCTGDVHSGSNVADHGGNITMHVGYDNLSAFLDRVVPTFADAERVVLSGASAGGFGAGFNFGRVQDLFGGTRVDLVDDSGPPLPAPYLREALEQQWRDAWGVDALLPPDCTACTDDLYALIQHDFARHPDSRKALLSYTRDGVISAFFQISGAQFEEGLGVFTDLVITPHPNAEHFFVTGTSHVLLTDVYTLEQGGVTLVDWLRQMIEDDPAWTSLAP